MFSVKGLMELVKAFGKFSLVCSFAFFLLWNQMDQLMHLDRMTVGSAISDALGMLAWSFLFMSASLLIIAGIDIPFQIFQHMKQIKMTHQEMKEEMKNQEGRPEVKGRIRKLQRELSNKRMLQDIPIADVILANPTHFSVALKYERDGEGAPKVIAKGADFMAQKIREAGTQYEIPILVLPSLARALYHTSEVGQEIPAGLYVSVAQVLAYVFQLRSFKPGVTKRLKPLKDNFDLPDEFQF